MKKYLPLLHLFFLTTAALAQLPASRTNTNASDTAINQLKCPPALLYRLRNKATTQQHAYIAALQDTAAFQRFATSHSEKIQIKGIWRDAQVYFFYTSDSFFYTSILPLSYLVFADSRTTLPQPELAIGNYNHSFNTINKAQAVYPSLTATGLTVSVKENLFDTTDIDFRQRIQPTTIASAITSSHASTIATLIGGAGNTYYTSTGVVKGITLSSASYEVLLPDTDAYARYGIHVQNHSYGVGIENYYGADAAAYDISMLKDTLLLHVFSSGNAGTTAAASGSYKGISNYANITGSFKMAKNSIVAGSQDASFAVPALSSRGPAYDGRIKPELVAYGEDGSSGAAALVSGAALFLQDAYRSEHTNTLPASALVKAVLINSATDIGNPGPDYTSGYGALNLWRAATTLFNRQYLYGQVQQGNTVSFPLTVPAQAANLKITLVWNDTAAAANAATALVHDLDLVLYHPETASTWQPWILHSTAHADSLALPAGTGRDSLNVAEQITLPAPAPGTYQLQVKGYRLTGTQPFYIAYQWDTLQQFNWTSPVHTDHFLPGDGNIFKWDYNGTATTGELAISYDQGAHWQVIAPAVNLKAPYYRWAAPDTFVTAIARIRAGSQSFVSEQFTICYQPYPAVGFSCNDSLLLYWHPLPGATFYRLYQLQNKYLQPVQEHISDTSIIIYHPAANASYYAIAPVTGDGVTGSSSYAIDYQMQGAACYFNTLLADMQPGNTGLINVQLGSLYNLSTVSIEKRTRDGWQNLHTYPISAATSYTVSDSNLVTGPNTYRSALTTINGGKIYSDAASLYYWAGDDFIIYPTPVSATGQLQLLSRDPFNKTAILYQSNGRKVWQRPVNNSLEQFSMAGLAAGVYFLVIQDEGKKLAVKKVVVQ